MDTITGLKLAQAEKKNEVSEVLEQDIEAPVLQRLQAKKDKNWKLADEIRNNLKARGIVLEDKPDGTRVVWKDENGTEKQTFVKSGK
jgi:cysteinyl-tRNA synthetase